MRWETRISPAICGHIATSPYTRQSRNPTIQSDAAMHARPSSEHHDVCDAERQHRQGRDEVRDERRPDVVGADRRVEVGRRVRVVPRRASPSPGGRSRGGSPPTARCRRARPPASLRASATGSTANSTSDPTCRSASTRPALGRGSGSARSSLRSAPSGGVLPRVPADHACLISACIGARAAPRLVVRYDDYRCAKRARRGSGSPHPRPGGLRSAARNPGGSSRDASIV